LIIKNTSTNIIIICFFLLILPFVQKQWLNLYQFNFNNISLYSILYYLSGIICPFLISLTSLNNFTNYKFNKLRNLSKKIINGKALFFLVTLNLIFLSYLIFDYFFINFDIVHNLYFERLKLEQPSILSLCFIIFFISSFLISKKFRIYLKRLIFLNFILISFFIWYMQINNIKINDQFHIYKYYLFDKVNLINIFILIAIEILYFSWSFLSYKSNLSDWIIYIPKKGDLTPFFKMLFFYFFIVIYYSILI